MKNEDCIIIASKELLWGASFMEQFNDQLRILYNNKGFMSEIKNIKNAIGQNEFNDIQNTKTIIKDEIWRKQLTDTYKEFKDIVYAVKNNGNAGTSAYISIYFSIRIMELQQLKNSLDEYKLKHNDEKNTISDIDFRKKWPANYRSEDGHYVRSKSEMLIDNWLYSHGICHAYEKSVYSNSGTEQFICDFYVPSYNTYLEYWGLDNHLNSYYHEKKIIKENFYKSNNYKLVGINEDQIMLLDDIFGRLFR